MDDEGETILTVDTLFLLARTDKAFLHDNDAVHR
jgi:hypothetical protein